MHAVIKIVCFLVFGTAMVMGTKPLLLAGFILVALLYLFELVRGMPTQLRNALKMLKRLRWLFLSILVVYLFFTPGILLLPDVLWGPTQEGLTQGLLRIAVLVLIVAAVNILIGSTGQAEFLSAVSWCLQPLSWLGLSHERLAVRISLTLAAVGVLRTACQHETRDEISDVVAKPAESSASEPKLMAIAKTAHQLFAKVIDDAEQASLQSITLPEQSRPPLVQWAIPVLLVILLLAVKIITMDVG
ncbi:MAG: energy-coupling factor transporter transmembrane protein EcfT [Gammaproteobacteria bacterium]|nr:energy-coupling factor transporter transmembrane protein EcfT [Gammaproteobacteria bacterium]